MNTGKRMRGEEDGVFGGTGRLLRTHPSRGTARSRGRAAAELVASPATPIAATAPVSPVNRAGTPGVTLTTQVNRIDPACPICSCGCGEQTKGGKYKPGHDSKHRSKLRNDGVIPPQVHYGKAKVKNSGLRLVVDNSKRVVKSPLDTK